MKPTLDRSTGGSRGARTRGRLATAILLAALSSGLRAQNEQPAPATEPAPPPASQPTQPTQPAQEAPVDETRTLLEKWIEIRKTISAEKRDAALAKESLTSRTSVVARELSDIEAKIAEGTKSLEETEAKRAELDRKRETQIEALKSLEEGVATLEARTRSLLARLPDPIQAKVRTLSQRLPAEGVESKDSLSQRFQAVIGILNEVQKFNREITMVREERKLSADTTAEVTAVYIGLGQGYYVSTDGKWAAIGFPGEKGWEWKDAPEAASAIQKVVAVLKDEASAEFIPVPVSIK